MYFHTFLMKTNLYKKNCGFKKIYTEMWICLRRNKYKYIVKFVSNTAHPCMHKNSLVVWQVKGSDRVWQRQQIPLLSAVL